jgi:hypothetical protein
VSTEKEHARAELGRRRERLEVLVLKALECSRPLGRVERQAAVNQVGIRGRAQPARGGGARGKNELPAVTRARSKDSGRDGGSEDALEEVVADMPPPLEVRLDVKRGYHELAAALFGVLAPVVRTAAMLVPLWKVVLRRQAAELPDLLELLLVGVALEDRPLGEHLAQDAADAPDVDRGPVFAEAEKELRRPVPAGDDHVGVLWRAGLVVGSREAAEDRAREAKVGNLKHARIVDEDVGRLEITVDQVVLASGRVGQGSFRRAVGEMGGAETGRSEAHLVQVSRALQ